MAVLSDTTLRDLAQNGLVHPFQEKNLSPCSIDLTLSDSILVESLDDVRGPWAEVDITHPYPIKPKQFFLASTAEYVKIPPHCSAQILLRSTAARMGFDHSLAGWLDPSFEGQITLELSSKLQLHNLEVVAGQRLIQLIVFNLDHAPERSYAVTGNYQNQVGPTISNLNV